MNCCPNLGSKRSGVFLYDLKCSREDLLSYLRAAPAAPHLGLAEEGYRLCAHSVCQSGRSRVLRKRLPSLLCYHFLHRRKYLISRHPLPKVNCQPIISNYRNTQRIFTPIYFVFEFPKMPSLHRHPPFRSHRISVPTAYDPEEVNLRNPVF